MAAFPSGLFFYDKTNNVMSCDMSQLDEGDLFRNVFDTLPSGDKTLTIVSDRTETAVEFVVKFPPTPAVPFWELTPMQRSIAKTPSCRGMRVIIINT